MKKRQKQLENLSTIPETVEDGLVEMAYLQVKTGLKSGWVAVGGRPVHAGGGYYGGGGCGTRQVCGANGCRTQTVCT